MVRSCEIRNLNRFGQVDSDFASDVDAHKSISGYKKSYIYVLCLEALDIVKRESQKFGKIMLHAL